MTGHPPPPPRPNVAFSGRVCGIPGYREGRRRACGQPQQCGFCVLGCYCRKEGGWHADGCARDVHGGGCQASRHQGYSLKSIIPSFSLPSVSHSRNWLCTSFINGLFFNIFFLARCSVCFHGSCAYRVATKPKQQVVPCISLSTVCVRNTQGNTHPWDELVILKL